MLQLQPTASRRYFVPLESRTHFEYCIQNYVYRYVICRCTISLEQTDKICPPQVQKAESLRTWSRKSVRGLLQSDRFMCGEKKLACLPQTKMGTTHVRRGKQVWLLESRLVSRETSWNHWTSCNTVRVNPKVYCMKVVRCLELLDIVCSLAESGTVLVALKSAKVPEQHWSKI